MTSWFRSWHGAPTDNKWLVIASKAKVKPGVVSAIAWALFDYASQNDNRGSVEGFDTETYSVFSGFDELDITNVIDTLRTKGVIAPDGRLSAWDKRQPRRERDDETPDAWRERKRQQRARNGNGANVTPSHAKSRHVTNTESESDPESESSSSSVSSSCDTTMMMKTTTTAVSCWNENMPSAASKAITGEIEKAVSRFGVTAVTDAITKAGRYGAKSWEYVRTVLEDGNHTGETSDTERVNGVVKGFNLAEIMGDNHANAS